MAIRKDAAPAYADSEVGAVRKKWRGRISVALVYPNAYAVGMSNLGFQTVYRLLNQREDVVCERAFFSLESPSNGGRICSVESRRNIADFDLIAFSVSFETDYLNLIAAVEQAGLPLHSAARGVPHPLVIAGGVACLLNPEPIAPFIDCFLMGEAERLIPGFFDVYTRGRPRQDLLEDLASDLPGAYVPRLYTPTYDTDDTLSGFSPTPPAPDCVQRIYVQDPAGISGRSAVLTPHTPFSSEYLMEVGRGCPHGCRFCSAGYCYRPPRFRPWDHLNADLAEGASLANRIGLVGAAVSDLPHLPEVCRYAGREGLDLAFSSLRADALSDGLLETLARCRVKTATLAPDAGSERLRKVINKGLTKTHLLAATRRLVTAGIPNLKLYFMIGLPTETDGDIEQIIQLCSRIKAVFLDASRPRKRIGSISVSINPFVPKPLTPFQWAAMEPQGQLKAKITHLRQAFKKIPNLNMQAEAPKQAYVQALLSRGDRRVADILLDALQNRGNWARTLKAARPPADFFALRERPVTERLPWDFIDHGLHKDFLIREYRRGLAGKTSPPCPMTDCSVCGVCG